MGWLWGNVLVTGLRTVPDADASTDQPAANEVDADDPLAHGPAGFEAPRRPP